MKNLINGINAGPTFGYTVEGWNASVRRFFGPYVRRRSILTRYRESLRTELVNLAQIEPFLQFSQLLRRILRKYRAIIQADGLPAFRFMVDCLEGTWRADEHWMSLFLTCEPLMQSSRLHDRAIQMFTLLGGILERCYKPQLRVIHGFAARDRTGRFPSDIRERDFGKLLSFIPDAYSSQARILTEDPECRIPVNQWRNIAAHNAFTVTSGSTIQISFGRGTPRSEQITFTTLARVVEWAKRSLATARMANVIIYLEYLPELKKIGLPDVQLRLESRLVTICHNLKIVGFENTTYGEDGDTFVLSLRDRFGRTPLDAIIHASQALDQISDALEGDPTTRHRFRCAMIRLVDAMGRAVARASIKIEDAAAWTQGRLSQSELVKRTTFDFADWVQARKGPPGSVVQPQQRRN